MQAFDAELTQRIIFGENTIEKLGEVAKALGGTQVFIVSDPGIQKAGILARACAALNSEKITYHVFADVAHNPTTQPVAAAVSVARANSPVATISVL